MKRLVVTADDVGLHRGMTAGAMRAHDQGIVGAVSLCAVGGDFAGAVEALRERPRLEPGVHLVLVGERPLSPAASVASLVGQDGRFLPGFRAFTLRYALRRIAIGEVELELRAQIETVLRAGIRPVHLNSHQHLHVLPRVLEVVLRLAREYDIPWVRVPTDPAVAGAGRRSFELHALDATARGARRRLERHSNLRACAHSAGLLHAGHLTVERLLEIIARVEDSTELVCHPGIGDGALASAYDWSYRWDEETAALCDPRLPTALAGAGVLLAGFRDL